MHKSSLLILLATISSSCAPNPLAGPRGPQGLPGEQGPTGPKGDRGDEGPRGYTGAGVVWRDANGNTVGYGNEPLYIDSRGFQWRTEPITGQPYLPEVSADFFYATNDCSGTPFVLLLAFQSPTNSFAPRKVFRAYLGDHYDTIYRTLPDTFGSTPLIMRSRNQGPTYSCNAPIPSCPLNFSHSDGSGACVFDAGILIDWATTAPNPPIQLPTINIAAPLHLEASSQ
jgi:hypothetical protein